MSWLKITDPEKGVIYDSGDPQRFASGQGVGFIPMSQALKQVSEESEDIFCELMLLDDRSKPYFRAEKNGRVYQRGIPPKESK